MEQAMQIRAADIDDYAGMAGMLHALATAFITPGMTTEAAATFLRSNDAAALLAYRRDGHLSSVALVDGVIAGFITIRPPSHLFHLFVGQQWQRRGIARALWDSVPHAAGFTVNSSPYAVPVYAALGFTCTGPMACHMGVSFQPMVYQGAPQ
jgi:GNAT superfamily N-acetyltransferase